MSGAMTWQRSAKRPSSGCQPYQNSGKPCRKSNAGASTRLPAAVCGIVGLKPTLGLAPHNQLPDAFGNFIHLGVMSRTVADAAMMLGVIAGAEGRYDLAVRQFERALQIDPTLEDARRNLEQARRIQGARS